MALKTYLVERRNFTRSIGVLDTHFTVSYVGQNIISGIITVNDDYLCAVDIWTNSDLVELFTFESNKNEIKTIEKLFMGRWAE